MRVKTGTVRRHKHKKIRNAAKGYYGQKSSTFRKAKEAVIKSLQYSYAHRKDKKGDFRRLWITRINAAAREEGLSYSRFIYGLKKAGVKLNRQILAELAVNDKDAFKELANIAKSAIEA